jgi:hypothetical protein
MRGRPIALVVGCLFAAPLAAQDHQPPPVASTERVVSQAGPRLVPQYQSHQPQVAQSKMTAAAAAADRVTITITTLGLILLIVLLLILIV